MSKPLVHHIIDRIGSEAIERELKLTKFSIRAAKQDGLFPARWYAPLRALCEAQGVECPEAAFRWIEADKKVVGGQAQNQ